MNSDLQRQIQEAGVIAVVTVESVDTALPLARALLDGGVTGIELTLRTGAAIDVLKKFCAEVPELLVGAGTVITPQQVTEVKAAGAAFAVAPGMSRRVLEAAQAEGLPFAPGICTPSEIEAALELDYRCLKFFPSEPLGGLNFLKTMAKPYAHLGLRFIPLGGVSPQNASSYLAEPSVLALGGSWIAPADAIRGGDWAGITRRAREAMDIVHATRA